jgi:hypothetical protein
MNLTVKGNKVSGFGDHKLIFLHGNLINVPHANRGPATPAFFFVRPSSA